MKLLKKSTSVVGVLFAVAIALVSCQEKFDVMAPLDGIADEKIPATYSYTEVDTLNFTTTVYEYTFESGGDSTANHGTYVVASLTGDGKATRVEKKFTYERKQMNEDNLSYNVDLTYEDGTKVTVKWGSASITDDKFTHNGPKRADNMLSIAESMPNKKWEFSSDTLYIDEIRDTIAYIKFVSAADYLTVHEIDSVDAWLRSDEGKAAILWWNEHLDVVKGTKITRDTVRVFWSKQEVHEGDTAYNCAYYHWYKDTIVSLVYDTIGPKVHMESAMELNFKNGQTNTGSYTFTTVRYGRDYYDKGNTSAVKTENIVLDLNHWGVTFNGTLLNAKAFTIYGAASGVIGTKSFAVKSLDVKKGTASINDLVYKVEATE